MLLSLIPQFPQKYKKFVWILLTPTLCAVLCALLFNCPRWFEAILNNLLYPAMIYLTFQTNVSNRILNYLGALSFGLYAFQSVARCFELWGVSDLWILFAIVLIPTLAENLVKNIIRAIKKQTTPKVQKCS